MRRRIASSLTALLVVSALLVGAATLPSHTERVDEDITPIGEAEAVVPAAIAVGLVAGGVSCTQQGGISVGPCTDSVSQSDLMKSDATETHKEIYTRGAQQNQNNDHFFTAMDNYLQDTQETALMIGKNEYIRQLENGSGEATARAKAKEAVADYYSKKQVLLLEQRNTTATTVNNMRLSVENTSGLSRSGVFYLDGAPEDLGPDQPWYPYPYNAPNNHTLANGSTVEVEQIYYNYGNADLYRGTFLTESTLAAVGVTGPNSNFNNQVVFDPQKYLDTWNSIETQNTEVQTEIDNFVDNTYNSYTQGKINTSDLIDPYLASRSYSPEDQYGTWGLRTMQSLGIDTPKDLSNVGKMKVAYKSNVYEGVLLSDGTPSGGSFDVGTTYDSANISGKQVILDESAQDLIPINGTFTIQSVESPDGNNLSTVEYRQVNYSTADTSEYAALMDELANLTAEINARQDDLRSGGGGGGGLLSGGLLSGFSGIGPLSGQETVLVGGVLVVLLLVRS